MSMAKVQWCSQGCSSGQASHPEEQIEEANKNKWEKVIGKWGKWGIFLSCPLKREWLRPCKVCKNDYDMCNVNPQRLWKYDFTIRPLYGTKCKLSVIAYEIKISSSNNKKFILDLTKFLPEEVYGILVQMRRMKMKMRNCEWHGNHPWKLSRSFVLRLD